MAAKKNLITIERRILELYQALQIYGKMIGNMYYMDYANKMIKISEKEIQNLIEEYNERT